MHTYYINEGSTKVTHKMKSLDNNKYDKLNNTWH